MINALLMSLFFRIALIASTAVSLTSCQTIGGLMNSLPFRMLDEAAASALSMIAENDLPAGSRPESIEARGRRVEQSGMYAGRKPAFVLSPREAMASR